MTVETEPTPRILVVDDVAANVRLLEAILAPAGFSLSSASIPGVRLLEFPHADRCCGSAGVYGLTQREMSIRSLDEKMRDIRETGAEVIATANPGCMTQLEGGLRRHRMNGRVVHIVELLDESYRRRGIRV